jgi:ureidoacrylate peracid hydrolase
VTAAGRPRGRRWGLSPDTVDLAAGHAVSPVTLPARPQRLIADLAASALVVVDMQNDFCHRDGWLAGIGVDTAVLQPVVSDVARLTAAVRARGVPVIWLNWGNRPDLANLPPNVLHVYDPDGLSAGIGRPAGHDPAARSSAVLTKDSWGAQLTSGLEAVDGDVQVDKYRMSGFFDTPLDSILRQLRADTVFFAGVNMDQCVLATLTDAASLGYDCVLVEGACGTTSPEFCAQATVYNVRQCFGFTVTTDEMIAALRGAEGKLQ